MKLTKIVAAVAVAAGLAASGSAMAFSLGGYQGPVKFEIGNLDAGTTGYSRACGGVAASNTNIADCNAAASSPAPSGQTITVGSPPITTTEDTWAIFSVSRIVADNPSSTTLWTAGTGGEYLNGLLFGLADYSVSLPGGGFVDAAATGGFIDLFLQSTTYNGTAGPAGRTGLTSYTSGAFSIPGGTPFLQLQFDVGADADPAHANATYTTFYKATTTSGLGQGYLSVIGGNYADMFDTDQFINNQGGKSDMFLTTTFDNSTGQAAPWTASSVSQAKAVVPEPASLALFGIGLAGLGFAARRRKSA